MKVIQTIICVCLLMSFLGCGKEAYMTYPEAVELFEKGVSEERIMEIYGDPSDIMDFENSRSLYYDHSEIIESMDDGDEISLFKVNFREGISYNVEKIIVTKRHVYP